MKLKEIREKFEISQKQLAINLGIPYKNYNQYELGNVEPSLDTMIKIADYFRISLDALVGRKEQIKLDLTTLEPEQRELVEIIAQMNRAECTELIAYAKGLQRGRERVEERFKFRGGNN